MTEKKSYEVEVTCFNCWKDTEIAIPFGVTVKSAMGKRKCPNCGCVLDSRGILTERKAKI